MDLRVGDVFVPGGQPSLTYVARQDELLERTMKHYAYGPKTAILSVAGPTKTGKTVLLRHYFPDAIWLTGGTIDSVDSFWESISDELELFTDRTLTVASDRSGAHTAGGGLDGGVVNANYSHENGTASSKGAELSRSRSHRSAARQELLSSKRTVVIDDFHYIDPAVQVDIVRGIKDLVFSSVPFIFAAVPHRAYDVVRVEKEMTARVQQLNIGLWTDADLMNIARQGFRALNVIDPGEKIAQRLVTESFASPQLMQQFCLNLCMDNDVFESQPEQMEITEPEWAKFLADCTMHTSKTAFNHLRTGPRQRTDRKPRVLRNGLVTDMYGVVLAAIEETGPKTQIQYEELRAGIKRVTATSEPQPQRHEVTRVLDEMTKIARERIEGEPVIEYDDDVSMLYIADPFFAFYLRHAPHELKGTAPAAK